MPTKDTFNSEHRLFRFLADEHEQQGMAKARDRAVLSSRVLNASIWAAAATALGIAILSVGNPVTLFADLRASIADVKASLVDRSALQAGTDRSAPIVQPTADLQVLSPTAKEAPAREEIAAASEPVGQTENGEPAFEDLFRQFQAWAAENKQHVGPVQSVQPGPAQVGQNAPARVAEDTPASLRPVQKRRHIRPVHNARAEMRPVHNPRKKVLREQSSRIQDPPAEEARAQEQSQVVEKPQASPFQQTFGWQN